MRQESRWHHEAVAVVYENTLARGGGALALLPSGDGPAICFPPDLLVSGVTFARPRQYRLHRSFG